ncbi:hypothetical protein HOLleu_11584 [Holothuria leucospilota]|uniref:Uncharacterized protein n=1 Tax=Holothuria leucospilota TaxID=206669 RepID=A0A9Q1CGD7_HOLLE|nr:hypothetical protein HOLleu_11584 [Holothuria leucospilota]
MYFFLYAGVDIHGNKFHSFVIIFKPYSTHNCCNLQISFVLCLRVTSRISGRNSWIYLVKWKAKMRFDFRELGERCEDLSHVV